MPTLINQHIPNNQLWLIRKMRAFGYQPSKRGICFGVAKMAENALLADDLDAFNARINLIYAKNLENLSKMEEIDIRAFFDSLTLYHDWETYTHLFSRKMFNQLQALTKLEPMLASIKLEAEGKIELANFTGIYTERELIAHFEKLKNILLLSKDIPTHTPMILRNIDHTITIGFDKKNNCWTIINAENLAAQQISNEETLAKNIFDAFSANDTVAFSTKIAGTLDTSSALRNTLSEWQHTSLFQKTHSPRRKTNLTSADLYAWLNIATLEDDKKTIKKLLKMDIDINAPCAYPGNALYIAALLGYEDIVKELLTHKANIHSINTDGETALFAAVATNNLKMAAFLLRNDANPNCKRTDGATPLFMAAFNGNLRMLKLLLDHYAKASEKCDELTNPLYIAAQEGHTDIVKKLLKEGVDPNKMSTSKGSTPLMIAAKSGHKEIVRLLLKAFANPQAKFQDLTAYDIALHFKHRSIARMLETYSKESFAKNGLWKKSKSTHPHETTQSHTRSKKR